MYSRMRYSHGGEIDGTAGATDGLLEGIEFDSGEAQQRVGYPLAATDEGLRTGDELSQIEGLGEVVVGAGVEQINDGGGLAAGGQDQHRGLIPRGAQLLQQGAAVEQGQHQIEHNQVVAAILGEGHAQHAIGRMIDGKSRPLAQGRRDILRQPGLVLDQ
jgi:hypothetical protein